MSRNRTLWLPVAMLAFGCTEPQMGPDIRPAEQDLAVPGHVHANAATYWNGVARGLVIEYVRNPYQAVRGYALLSIAQYNGAAATEPPYGRNATFEHAAMTRAAVDVLSYLFPDEEEELAEMAAAYLDATSRPDAIAAIVEAGVQAGAAAAAAIIERALTDGWFAPWSGTVPTGPGKWFSSAVPPAPPVLPLLGQAKPFLLTSGDQFRPAPPPAFGSPEFNAALAEVRSVADNRTPEQTAIARFWALPGGTYTPPGFWNEEASRLAEQLRLGELETAHMLALMNMVGADALIAGHDAKYAYWLIRPSQADPGIQLAVGLPNFPSYMSNHATLSAGMARIIAHWFPSERDRLEALAEEAAMSRLYGGIHYRFDNEAGLRAGRQIAAWGLAHDVKDGEVFVLE